MNRKVESLNDIANKKVVEKIEEYTDVILKFADIVNSNLYKATLKEPQIYIVRTSENSFKIYWCFSYNDEYDKENIFKVLCEDKYIKLQSCLMVFDLSITLKETLSSYFQLYITGNKPEYISSVARVITNKSCTAIDILSYNVILQCIDKINEVYKKVLICKQIDEVKDKPSNVEDVLSKHCVV